VHLDIIKVLFVHQLMR